MYLASIFKSLYEYDRLIRSLLLGLAGNDLRKAMEIFLEFCKSGHIGAKEFWKIKAERGQWSLPYYVVTRVLLRRSRRYYDGDNSFLANLYQCDPDDAEPNTFVRLAILQWLDARSKSKGPSNIKGFFPATMLITDLVSLGHDALVVYREMSYLVKRGCILTEHQKAELQCEKDLVSVSPSGFMHLQMSSEPTYLAACAEDSWVESRELAEKVRQRIGEYGPAAHFSPATNLLNAKDFVEYLLARAEKERVYSTNVVNTVTADARDQIRGAAATVEKAYEKYKLRRGELDLKLRFPSGSEFLGTVSGTQQYGVFVRVDKGPKGLIYYRNLPEEVTVDVFQEGMRIKVKVDHVEEELGKLSLHFVEFVEPSTL
jgi:hypothetical protein